MNPDTAAASTPKSADPAAIIQQQFDEKFKALEGILTPEQSESYRKFQETQLKMVNKFLPQFGQPKPPGGPAPGEVRPK